MDVDVRHDLRDDPASDIHAYVCQKIGAHLGPVPRRVLLSEIQTDADNPFSRRTLHHDLMSALCYLESSGVVAVGASGLEINTTNLPNI